MRHMHAPGPPLAPHSLAPHALAPHSLAPHSLAPHSLAPHAGSVWFDGARARAWGTTFGVAMLVILAGAYGKILAPLWHVPPSPPMASDFDPFWSGARLALRGTPALAYDAGALRAAENTGATLPAGSIMIYQYPPSFLLLSLPLGLLPYTAALVAFLGLSLGAAMWLLRQLMPAGWPVFPVAASPATITNAIIGQNAFVSGALFAAAALWLDERPLLAGACLGGFACKPHLAIAVPVALAAARRWQALAAAAASGLAFLLASWLVLGTAPWNAFFHTLWLSRAILQSDETGPKVITIYAAIRLLHGTAALATTGQSIVALAALGLTALAARRRHGGFAEIALTVPAGLLAIPYAMDYDLFTLLVPMAWLARQGATHGWRPWEKPVLLACFILPLVVRTVNLQLGLPLAPPLLGGVFALIVSRQMARAA